MNTRLIMASSALFLSAIGIILTFAPAEVLNGLEADFNKSSVLILQLHGGLYFGFAMLNWMSQWSVIGGIYNKPVSVANFSNFFVGAMALIKQLITNPLLPKAFWIFAVIYGIYALIFGWLFYSGKNAKTE
ncbi:hypothetical protein [Mucilaginibacter auburnensis]|uniref:Uncharacterized protein n=1 Tax=Mucilaginibacter auburnensis TaxID=1457233 RepID=A0A2H9VVV6_9SPHI|nr:hypothetical protein [Mucilaginibacter auburnensis]PJJ84955.1 hypothetical protein CLV57_1977 [Mucilaginibacter auburnensis]